MTALTDLPKEKQEAVHDAIGMFKCLTDHDHLDEVRLAGRVIEMFEDMSEAAKMDGSTQHDPHGLFLATSMTNCASIMTAIEAGEYDAAIN